MREKARRRFWQLKSTKERPRWWPESEPWPAEGSHWQHIRPVVWRLAIGLLLAVVVAIAFVLLLAWALGLLTGPSLSVDLGIHRALVWIGLLVVVGVAALAVFRWLLRPIASLVEAAEKVSQGDLDVRVEERGPRDVRVLARAFNEMAARLEATEAQRRALLADVTHELRTPLTVIQGDLEALLDGVYPRDDEQLRSLLEESRHLGRLVEDLRTLALADAGELKLQREPVDPGELAAAAVAAFAGPAADARVTLRCERPSAPRPIEADATRVRQVIANLLSNALRYTPRGGEIVVSVTAVARDDRFPAGGVRISVQDSGAGISAEDLPIVFERFRRSADSTGSGLGLTIARDLVVAHGGRIWVESDGAARGTTVTFDLPVR